MKAKDIFENKNSVKYAIIAASAIVLIYVVTSQGSEVAGGVANGAELAGGGIGLAALAVPFILLL